jgi:hypothetical protein
MTTRINIQLAPTRHVTNAMRTGIATAFLQGDLSEARWVPMIGDPSDAYPERNVAPPSLAVIVTPDDGAHPADAVAGAAAQLALVLAHVRGGFPDIPISLRVVALDETTHRYAFRPTDTPEEIQRAFAACPTPAELDALGPTIGWDLVRWISLNDEIAVTHRPSQRPST